MHVANLHIPSGLNHVRRDMGTVWEWNVIVTCRNDTRQTTTTTSHLQLFLPEPRWTYHSILSMYQLYIEPSALFHQLQLCSSPFVRDADVSSALFWLALTLFHCQKNYPVDLSCLLTAVVPEWGCLDQVASLKPHRVLCLYSIHTRTLHVTQKALFVFDVCLVLAPRFVVSYCSTSAVIYFWCVSVWCFALLITNWVDLNSLLLIVF